MQKLFNFKPWNIFMGTYETFSDQELTALLKAGDRAAFSEIYNRYWQSAYHAAFNVLNDDEACMDVLQDVFVWLWQHHEKLNINALKVYLLTAVKFKMLNVIRKGKLKSIVYRDVQTEQFEKSSPEDNLEIKELMRIIDEFADNLPVQAKQIFHLSRKEHLSNKEIARQMGISEKTIKNQINITLKKLKTRLGRMSLWMVLFY